uniref:Uncharacterized protein n=1 Tax=Panagrellus redivivus TaxID=6233 RepID=A0A7E4V0K0_PANRE
MFVVDDFLTLLIYALLLFPEVRFADSTDDDKNTIEGQSGIDEIFPPIRNRSKRDANDTDFVSSTINIAMIQELVTTPITMTTVEAETQKPKIPPYVYIIVVAIILVIILIAVAMVIFLFLRKRQQQSAMKKQKKRPRQTSSKSAMTTLDSKYDEEVFPSVGKTTTVGPSTSKETTQHPSGETLEATAPQSQISNVYKVKHDPIIDDVGEKKRATSKETAGKSSDGISSDVIGSLNPRPVPPPKQHSNLVSLDKTAKSWEESWKKNGSQKSGSLEPIMDKTQREDDSAKLPTDLTSQVSITGVTTVSTVGASEKEVKTKSTSTEHKSLTTSAETAEKHTENTQMATNSQNVDLAK